ncbi:MAG: DUF3179 domain-containing (seleno)protein [Nannocystaceae bacterium]
MSLIPRLADGTQLTFRVGGLYNGMVLLKDTQTGSDWDHITGECVNGKLRGTQLEVIGPLGHGDVAATLAGDPDAQIHLSRQSWLQKFLGRLLFRVVGRGRGILPPHFASTMGEADTRLPREEVGLGVWHGRRAVFYSLAHLRAKGGAVVDRLGGRCIVTYIDPVSGSPQAIWHESAGARVDGEAILLDDGAKVVHGKLHVQEGVPAVYPELPRQTLTRWYGFSYTFANVEIAGQPSEGGEG